MEPNYFFRYAKKHSICQSEVSPFLGPTKALISNKYEIWCLLLDQFNSVFTKPNPDMIVTNPFSFFHTQSSMDEDKELYLTNILLSEFLFIEAIHVVVVVVCPLQPSSSVNSGCPGPESSILVSSRWACPISSQVTDHWGELRNRTDEVHPVDPFHSLDILKNHSASVAFCRNLGVYNVQNGAVIELSFVVSVKGFPRH